MQVRTFLEMVGEGEMGHVRFFVYILQKLCSRSFIGRTVLTIDLLSQKILSGISACPSWIAKAPSQGLKPH